MTEIKLFISALRYVEKGYSREDLRWGDDLYNVPPDEREIALDFYDEIQENGTKWAHEHLKTLKS